MTRRILCPSTFSTSSSSLSLKPISHSLPCQPEQPLLHFLKKSFPIGIQHGPDVVPQAIALNNALLRDEPVCDFLDRLGNCILGGGGEKG